MIPTRPYSFREVEQLARDAGPWTDADTAEAKRLRELPEMDDEQRTALAVLRRREQIECARLRKIAALREP